MDKEIKRVDWGICSDPDEEYLPMNNAIEKSVEKSNETNKISLKNVTPSFVQPDIFEEVIEIPEGSEEEVEYIVRFCRVLEEVSKNKMTRRIIRNIKIKKWLNNKMEWLKINKRFDISEDYGILLREIFLRVCFFNDDNVEHLKGLLKDNCVEEIMKQRPAIDIEILKSLLDARLA